MAAPSQARVVGWTNRSEWEKVHHGLFSNEVRKQQQAIQRIAVWRSRMLHRLPVAVDCTAALVEACLECKVAILNGPYLENHSKLQHSLAMALIRFVNLMTEKSQNRQIAQPVHILAEELSIPQWLVELRHEASHTSMPSLKMLKSGAKSALKWLKREYWEAQSLQCPGDDEDNANDLSVEDKFKDLVYTFQEEQFKLFSELKQYGKAEKKEVRKILDDLEKTTLIQRNSSVGWLCEDGYLIATSEQLDALGIVIEAFINADSMVIPQRLLDFWKPVLKMFHHLKLIAPIVTHLLNQVTEELSLRNRLLTGWVFTLVRANSAMRPRIALFRATCPLPWKEMLETCIETPSEWMLTLITTILNTMDPPLSPSQAEKMKYLTAVYRGHRKQPVPSAELELTCKQVVHTLDEITCGEGSRSNEQQDLMSKKHVYLWQPCTESVEWSKVPIGMLPSQQLEYDSLELPDTNLCDMSEVEDGEDEDLEWEEMDTDTMGIENGMVWTPQQLQQIQREISLF